MKLNIIAAICVIAGLVMIFSSISYKSKRPKSIVYKDLVFENDTLQIFHYQKYRLVEIGIDTVYKKERRVRSTLEYQP